METVLKWAGGKKQLLNEIHQFIKPELLVDHTYYEPFVGGGSVFLSLEPYNAVINDLNQELINVYLQIRDNPSQLLILLEEYQKKHSKDFYYTVRNIERTSEYTSYTEVQKAARFIYLNKTCYNGLYRVNTKGQFNVPIGRYKTIKIYDEERICSLSNYLNRANVEIRSGSYLDAVSGAKEGDFIYLDPPYDYEIEGFKAYTSYGFSRDDLIELKRCCDGLIGKGCKVLISNNDTSYVRALFSDDRYTIKSITAKRMINSKGNLRDNIREVLIYGQ